MAQTFTLIPVAPGGQRFVISLDDTSYNVRVTCERRGGRLRHRLRRHHGRHHCCGHPVVTGADLLEQYRHLGFTGALFVVTDRDTGDVPTFDGSA